MRLARALVLSLSICLVAPAVASAKEFIPPIEGRHSVLRAGMYATVLDGGDRSIQIFDRLCPDPGHKAGCERVIFSLQEAIEDAVRRPITWVHREQRHGGTFWELAPIERVHAHASFYFRWDEPGRYGCHGGGTYEFERREQAWYPSGGNEFVGCP